ncbi:RNA exonuclease 4 [Ananas comosus]|uniref:RNA exonuclease 4 n=1 Tax=Ananas comosus TaxID=4615 RepID=A0A199UXM6_ANACO|nr:RNA exonuclease 4 [Ananas comosus]
MLHTNCKASASTNENKCAACFRQYNKMEHLVEHMRVSFHSSHEPKCGVCQKHCRSFESLREHLIGPLPKVDCARIFGIRGCNLCLNIFDSSSALRAHRTTCQYSRTSSSTDNYGRTQGLQVVALACKMVGGGSDGSYETTGIRPEHLREAMPLKQAQRKIQDLLCNGEPIWKIRSKDTKARILVGHGLDHDLDCLGVEYPAFLIRDTAKYPPLMKTSKLSNSLKYLTQAYLGQCRYEIQNGIQDPYDDCVGAMRLYTRMRSQPHPREYSGSGEAPSSNNYPSWRQREFERMSPEALLELSGSDYYCWCLDS